MITQSHFLAFSAPCHAISSPQRGLIRVETKTRTSKRYTTRAVSNSSLPEQKNIPPWSGTGPLSYAVNLLIGFEPLFGLMRNAARNVFIDTAEKYGVKWREEAEWLARNMSDVERKEALERITDPWLHENYPDYFLQPFHGYEEGNMDWLPAFEQRSATYAMSLRLFKDEPWVTASAAYEKLRSSHLEAIFANIPKTWLQSFGPKANEKFSVVDAGCGVGLSAVSVLDHLRTIEPLSDYEINALDASPYFLAIAERMNNDDAITYSHRLAEATSLPDCSCHWFGLQYVIHEIPAPVTADIFKEAFRVMRPGALLSLVDNNPQSETIQNLPPVLFTLMKSTEPCSDSYYQLDVAELLHQTGFVNVVSVASDHRHRTIVACKPSDS